MATAQRFMLPEMQPMELLEADPSANPPAAQRAYLMLDPRDQTCWITFRCQSENGTLMTVWQGLVQQFDLPETIDARELVRSVNGGAYDALFTRIVRGFATEWDGSNIVGTYTDDARAALGDLQNALDDSDLLRGENAGLWDASDWLDAIRSDLIERIAADDSDAALDRLAGELMAEAADESVVIGGLMDYLVSLRKDVRSGEDD